MLRLAGLVAWLPRLLVGRFVLALLLLALLALALLLITLLLRLLGSAVLRKRPLGGTGCPCLRCPGHSPTHKILERTR